MNLNVPPQKGRPDATPDAGQSHQSEPETTIQPDQDQCSSHPQQQKPEVLGAQLRRRREAALRLPPLACGCRDPLYCRCRDRDDDRQWRWSSYDDRRWS